MKKGIGTKPSSQTILRPYVPKTMSKYPAFSMSARRGGPALEGRGRGAVEKGGRTVGLGLGAVWGLT